MNDLLKKLPKVELHCHLDGSIRPETILDIAIKENISIPTTDLNEFKKLVQVSDECQSLKDYISKFDLPLKVMLKKEHIYRITKELLEDLSKDNVKYAELRFSPFFHMRGGLSFDEVLHTIIEAMESSKNDFGIKSNIILICMRHHTVEESIQVVKMGSKFLGKGVVAVDLAGNEHDFPPEIHEPAFKLAKKYGYKITIHAGETGICKNISTSIKNLFADRIGHGVYAYNDPEILDYIIQNKIPLEMCPTSNVQTKAVTSIKTHPIKEYLNKGVIVTVNTDNLTVSNTTLLKEYELLINELDFTYEDIKKVIENGINSSFQSEEEKSALIKQLNQF